MATVRIEDRDGGVRVLTLDRPPANAEDETLLTDLSAALDDARRDDAVRAVVLTGTTVWTTPESRAARAAQRRKLTG